MKISVVIPTTNRPQMLREALNSVRDQEPCGAEIETIVVGDHCTDETPNVAANYDKVRYIPTQQGTASGSRNVGLSCATGDWIAFLDDDDVWLPTKLKRFCETISAHPKVAFVFSATIICDHLLNHGPIWQGPDLAESADTYEAFLDDVLTPSAVMLRRDVFQKVGLFDPSVPRAEDRDMWLKVIENGYECLAITEPLILYRLREKENGDVLYSTYINTMKVFRRHFSGPSARRTTWRRKQSVLLRLRGWYTFQILKVAQREEQEGEKTDAKRHRRIAFSISPLHWLKYHLRK